MYCNSRMVRNIEISLMRTYRVSSWVVMRSHRTSRILRMFWSNQSNILCVSHTQNRSHRRYLFFTHDLHWPHGKWNICRRNNFLRNSMDLHALDATTRSQNAVEWLLLSYGVVWMRAYQTSRRVNLSKPSADCNPNTALNYTRVAKLKMPWTNTAQSVHEHDCKYKVGTNTARSIQPSDVPRSKSDHRLYTT